MIVQVDDPLTGPLTGLVPDIEIADGDAGDLFGPSGMVTIADTLTNGQTVSISAASSPLTGLDPKLDLFSLTISGLTQGILQIRATRTFFSPSASDTEFFIGIGGTTDGSVTATAYLDTDNAAFGTTTTIHEFTPFFAPAFSDSTTNVLSTPTPDYSLTLAVDVFHDDPFDVTSFDFFVSTGVLSAAEQPIPEPASLTLGMMGLAILGCFLKGTRRQRRTAYLKHERTNLTGLQDTTG